jgi:phosphoserine phosphatase
MEHIKGKPYIVAGDSSNDFYMLSIAEHPIWIERLNKPDYQKEKESFLKERNLKDWISQPVDPSKECKFISK